ncbi:MAG TPA: NnrS family protein, partial [Burkholderiaceae bacterium]|nr:NnrS family protein [Burkholderiaceae bacterium]
MPPDGTRARAAPWLAAPFRPFYALGVAYAVVLMALVGVDFVRAVPLAASGLWHGHEMIFGFAFALIAGTVLTALPSWAGIDETRGAPLALLVLAWVIGRAACVFASTLPWG